MGRARHDVNIVPTLIGVSSTDGDTPIELWVDPTTHELLVSSTAGSKWYISNTEDTGTYKYFGYEDKDGNWYIMRKTIATNIYLYATGTSGYSTAWTNRASQTYDSAAVTF